MDLQQGANRDDEGRRRQEGGGGNDAMVGRRVREGEKRLFFFVGKMRWGMRLMERICKGRGRYVSQPNGWADKPIGIQPISAHM